LLGAVIGAPIGVQLLRWTSPATLRISIGIVLILFSLYNLMRPQLSPVRAGKAGDGMIGVLNGVIGGRPGSPGLSSQSGERCGVGRVMSNARFSSLLASRSS